MGVYRIDPPVRLKPPSLVAVTFVATPSVVLQGLGPQRTQQAAYRRDNELRPYQQPKPPWIITGGVPAIAVAPAQVGAAYLRTANFPYLPAPKYDARTVVAADVFAPPQQWAAAYARPQSYVFYQDYRSDASFDVPMVPYKAPISIAQYARSQQRLDFPDFVIALNQYSALVADTQTYTVSGIAATLTYDHPLVADTQTYAVTGIDANLAWGGVQTADVTTFVLNGVDASLLYSAAPPAPDVTTTEAGGKGRARSPFRRVIVGNRAYLIKSDEDLQYLLNQVLAGDPPKKKSKVVEAPEEWEQKPIVPEIAAKVIEQTDNREVLAAIQKRLDDDDEADVEAILLLF